MTCQTLASYGLAEIQIFTIMVFSYLYFLVPVIQVDICAVFIR
jgi:hypothetical protein